MVRIFFIGDIVGKPGYTAVCKLLPDFIKSESLDLVIANAENAAGGSGLTATIYKELTGAGVHAITLGDHVFRKKDISKILESKDNIVRPANLPKQAPGKCWTVVTATNGVRVVICCLLGHQFMRPSDNPFNIAEQLFEEFPKDVLVRFVDFHAEATSEMQIMGRLLDGRASAVLGTHTHVTTADECIFPGGTAFQCDVGMTGPHESIIGRRIDRVLHTTLTAFPTQFDVATKDVRINGSIIEIDETTGKATAIKRIQLKYVEDN